MSSNLNISATESTVDSVLIDNNRYDVPDYQRRYSWGEEQWEAFWSDLNSLEEGDTHFLGSIVVIQHSPIDSLNWRELVDGQQRLTTITILLSVMRERYLEAGDENNHAETIKDDYLREKDLDNNYFPKLTLSKFDDEDYQAILEGRSSDVDNEQLEEAVKFFRKKIADCDLVQVDELRKRLLSSMTLVIIDCDSEQSAFRLFETLNNRGLELSAVDLMKNFLLQVASDSSGADYDYIKGQWETILETVVREIKDPDRFFRDYIMAAPEPDYDSSVSSYKLYDTFREIVTEELPTETTSLSDYIDGMVEKATLYVELTQGQVDSVGSAKTQRQINQRLDNLDAINSVNTRPLLLRSFDELEGTEILEVLRTVEKFMLRWQVAGYVSGSRLDKVFSSLCSNAFDKDDPVEEIRDTLASEGPTDAEFRSSLVSKDLPRNARTKYLLDTLEHRHFMPSGKGKQVADRSLVDIEHIAPDKAFSAKKYTSWETYLHADESTFEQYKHRLGNLTLLESRHNARAGTNPFNEKKREYQTSDFEMTQAICDYESWSTKKIEERTEELADIAVKIWSVE